MVLVQYKGKVSVVQKLGKVVKVFPYVHGVERTCEVGFCPRHAGKKILPYKAKPLQELRTAVQRLCVLLPVEEQSSQADAEEEDQAAGVVPDGNPNEDNGEAKLCKLRVGELHVKYLQPALILHFTNS